ncbi:MAG TPA: D-alanyl-D-alanine carboxypeptidase family protein, partial [Clostridia bacterium]|nr:D-alanyl-D-alanine carboxypeptidase family protein [Clostridia bacterium]
DSEKPYPIASMVKIMTLLLTYEAIDEGKMDYDTLLTISENASGMGGSQMFLETGDSYSVSDLIKGVTVCSANDAAVALGEAICGDINTFVDRMNQYAKEIGMENTLFCNATGLPDNSKQQYSTAKDVSIMTRKLLTHNKYYEFSKIWMEDFKHPDGRVTQIVNTNKLVRFYKYCDAGKTGFTNEAMFCLSASAKLGDMRIVATVLGSPDSKTRFREITDMFNYCFANYETKVLLRSGNAVNCEMTVAKAKEFPPLELYCDRDLKFFNKKGANVDYKIQIDIKDNLVAPIQASTDLGTISVINSEGTVVCEGLIYSKHDIEKRKYLDGIEKVLRNWFMK